MTQLRQYVVRVYYSGSRTYVTWADSPERAAAKVREMAEEDLEQAKLVILTPKQVVP